MEVKTAATADLLSDINGAYDRLTEDELRNLGVVLGAVRMLRGARRKHLAYVSMPITSGKRYFDVLTEHGAKNAEELAIKCGKDALYELVIKPNVAEGVTYADKLGIERQDLLFIAPSVFEAKKWRWSQDAYMSMWYRVLGEMAGCHYLMDGWEYSTGGIKEVMFTVFMQNDALHDSVCEKEFGIKNFLTDVPPEQRFDEREAMRSVRIYESTGRSIDVIGALNRIADAANDLREKGFPYQDLVGPAHRMFEMVVSMDSCRLPPSWYDRLFAAASRLPPHVTA